MEADDYLYDYLLELTNERARFLKWISPSGVGGVSPVLYYSFRGSFIVDGSYATCSGCCALEEPVVILSEVSNSPLVVPAALAFVPVALKERCLALPTAVPALGQR